MKLAKSTKARMCQARPREVHRLFESLPNSTPARPKLHSRKKPSRGGGRAWHIRAAVASMFLLSASSSWADCGTPHLIGTNENLVREFMDCKTSRDKGHDKALQQTAFNIFLNLHKDEIIRRLKKQGFTCREDSCTRIDVHRQSWAEKHL